MCAKYSRAFPVRSDLACLCGGSNRGRNDRRRSTAHMCRLPPSPRGQVWPRDRCQWRSRTTRGRWADWRESISGYSVSRRTAWSRQAKRRSTQFRRPRGHGAHARCAIQVLPGMKRVLFVSMCNVVKWSGIEAGRSELAYFCHCQTSLSYTQREHKIKINSDLPGPTVFPSRFGA